MTFAVSGIGLSIGIAVGLIVAMLRMLHKRWLEIPILIYQDFFRTTPPLVQLVWVYYCVPVLGGIELSAFGQALSPGARRVSWRGVFRAGLKGLRQNAPAAWKRDHQHNQIQLFGVSDCRC
jgi:His/Glu/Gln/Arg/opine family amino acid ABC transporter permease subunit